MHGGEDAPKVLGHASISKLAVGARTSGGHHGWGGVPYKWGGHVGTSKIYVGIGTISLGRPHYSSSPPSSTTSYSLKHLCNHPPLLLHHHRTKRHQ